MVQQDGAGVEEWASETVLKEGQTLGKAEGHQSLGKAEQSVVANQESPAWG